MARLIEELGNAIEETKPRRFWFDKLPKNLQNELYEVRKEYHAGNISVGSKTIAVALVKMLERRSVRIGHDSVKKWLLKNSEKNSPTS